MESSHVARLRFTLPAHWQEGDRPYLHNLDFRDAGTPDTRCSGTAAVVG